MKRYLVAASLLMIIGFGAVAMEPAEGPITKQQAKWAERRRKEKERQEKKDAEKLKNARKGSFLDESKRPAELTRDVDMPRNSAPLAIRSRSGKTVYYQNGQPINPEMRRARKPRPDKLEEVAEQTEPEGTEGTDTAGYDDEI